MKRGMLAVKMAALVLPMILLGGPALWLPAAQPQAAQAGQPADITEMTAAGQPWLESAGGIPAEFEPVTQTAATALYADMSTGCFIFEDKAAGRLWYSVRPEAAEDDITRGIWLNQVRSQLLVEYVDTRTASTSVVPAMATSYGHSVRDGNVKVSRIENGIRVEFTFAEAELFIPVEYTLQGDGLSASIKGEEIEERSFNQIESIHLLPCFTAGGTGESGYLFVPDGSGAIAYLNNGKGDYARYEQPVYGLDATLEQKTQPAAMRKIALPVFGIKSGEAALTGIIVKGDADCRICANTSGEDMGYNRVYAKMVLAQSDSTTLYEADYFNMREIFRLEERSEWGDLEVRYYPLNAEKANYTGMAELYRTYLINNGQLQKNPQPPSLGLNLYGAAQKQASFLGIPYDRLTALTTFDQAREIGETLQAAGVDSLTVRLTGWTNNGLLNEKIPVKASPLSVLGGKSAYRELQEYLAQAGASLYSDVDFITIQKGGNGFSAVSDVSMTLFNMRAQKSRYMLSVGVPSLTADPWYLLKPQRLTQAAGKFRDSFDGLGAGGGLALSQIGETVYSDFHKNGSDRSQTIGYYRQVLEAFSGIPLAVDYGNAYTYGSAARIFALPVSDSAFMAFDDSVPFLQIVLHGYLPYTSEDFNRAADSHKMLLKCVETGADPYFCGMYADASVVMDTQHNDLYSSSFSNWSQTAAQVYAAYRQVHERLYDKAITAHERLGPDVYKTTFENAAVVYVNYGETAAEADGVTVPALDFVYREGAA